MVQDSIKQTKEPVKQPSVERLPTSPLTEISLRPTFKNQEKEKIYFSIHRSAKAERWMKAASLDISINFNDRSTKAER